MKFPRKCVAVKVGCRVCSLLADTEETKAFFDVHHSGRQMPEFLFAGEDALQDSRIIAGVLRKEWNLQDTLTEK